MKLKMIPCCADAYVFDVISLFVGHLHDAENRWGRTLFLVARLL